MILPAGPIETGCPGGRGGRRQEVQVREATVSAGREHLGSQTPGTMPGPSRFGATKS